MLRSLPPRVPPTGLTTSLRVIASRERQRLVEGRSLVRVFALWFDRTRFRLRDMLRPLMLPATGGVLSAVVLFSMWVVPTYPLRTKIAVDIPTQLSTDCKFSSFQVAAGLSDSVLVDVEVDDQGHLVDYQIVSGAAAVRTHRCCDAWRICSVYHVLSRHVLWDADGRQDASVAPAESLDLLRSPFRLAWNLRQRLNSRSRLS